MSFNPEKKGKAEEHAGGVIDRLSSRARPAGCSHTRRAPFGKVNSYIMRETIRARAPEQKEEEEEARPVLGHWRW